MQIILIAMMLLVSVLSAQGTKFGISIDPNLTPANNSGRLVLYVRVDGTSNESQKKLLAGRTQLIGVDVPDIKASASIHIDESASSYPLKFSELPAGHYKVEAVLDTQHLDSQWRREPGNLYGSLSHFEIKENQANNIEVKLSSITLPEPQPAMNGVEWFSLRSKLLSDFRGHDVIMRAGIILPANYDPAHRYAAVYEVPGFGGNHTYAAMAAARRKLDPHKSSRPDNVFWIVLDPEGPNGHTLFCDSDNNGPCGRALIEEFIPAIEAKFPLIAKPEARMVRGHSSGGWSSIWLAMNYPQTFGACFASSPDPVDFRKFEQIDIYGDKNLYTDASGTERPAQNIGDVKTRDENNSEEIVGPSNTSADQWDSWQACWGHRKRDGHVADLLNVKTGEINKDEAESYRRYDIADLVRKNPEKYLPLFHNHIRIVVGGSDTFFLNEAVALLQADLNKLSPPDKKLAGYIKIVPGKDHSTINSTDELKAFADEMRAIAKAAETN